MTIISFPSASKQIPGELERLCQQFRSQHQHHGLGDGRLHPERGPWQFGCKVATCHVDGTMLEDWKISSKLHEIASC